jgi:MYXO-CTERM domain-containing protein
MNPSTFAPRGRWALFATALLPSMFWAAPAAAQPIYFVTQSTAPYVTLVNGTPLNLQFDGQVTVPLGFEFNYYDLPYTHVSISENGYVVLPSPCSAGCLPFDEFCSREDVCEPNWLPPFGTLGEPFAPNRVIAPFWGSYLQDPGLNPAMLIRYATLGTAPNREFVVEWRDARWEVFPGPATTRFTFQVRLFEASGQIRFHYGPFTNNAADNFQWSTIAGIEDQNGGDVVFGPSCATANTRCSSTNMTTLPNRVITIGPPNTAELLAKVRPLGGANPGQPVQVAVDVQNVGLQAVNTPFFVDVYLAVAQPLIPGRDPLLGRVTLNPMGSRTTQTATLTAPIPLATNIGYYFGAAVVDATNAVIEASEANNLSFSTDPILVGPDVRPEIELFVPIASGEAGQVDFTMLNLSSAVGNTDWAIYLSFDSVLDGGDLLLGRGTVNLGNNEREEVSTTVTMPVLPPGYVQLLVVADPDEELAEVDEQNNVWPTEPFPVGPEFFIENITVPGISGAGEETTFDFFLSNIGAPVAAVEYQVFLSRDAILDGNDPLVGAGVTPAPGGQTLQVTATATIPSATTRGNYFLIVVVDPADLVVEVDEGNNQLVSNASFEIIGADLNAGSLSGDPRGFRGDPYTVEATIENIGGQTIRDFRYTFYLSTNRLITYQDPVLFESPLTTLAPGQRLTVRHTPTVSSTLAAGLYYLGLIVDSDGLIQEDRELNNTKISREAIEIRDRAPDFVVTEVRAPLLAASGEPVTLQRSLENVGNAAGTTPYQVQLLDEGGGLEPVTLGTANVTLAVGQVSDGVDTFVIPADLPGGTYRVRYRLDPDELVDEILNDNNDGKSADAIEVAAAQLQIQTKLLPPAVVAANYSVSLTAVGNLAPVTWSITSGALPTGLSLDGASGLLSGVPDAESTQTLTVQVTDGVQVSVRTYTLTVVYQPLELEVATRALPPAFAGRAYEYGLTAFGGVPPYTWSSEELPVGFTMTSSGVLVGATTVGGFSRAIEFVVSDSTGNGASRPITFRVLDPEQGLRFGIEPLADGLVGRAYDETLTALGGVAPYTYSVLDGELPPGLTLDADHLQGVPTRSGLYIVTIGVTDGRNDFDQNVFVIEIAPAEDAVRFLSTGLPLGKVGVAYLDEAQRAIQLRAIPSSAGTTVTFVVVGGELPAGVTLAADGVLSGTPSAAGTFGFLVRGQDESGRRDVRAFGVVIEGDPTNPGPTDTGDDGCSCSATHRGPAGDAYGWALAGGLLLFLRRKKRVVLLAAALLTVSTSAWAQNGQYIILEEDDPYVERSGGTALSFNSIDDGQADVVLPFPFRFFESDHTNLSIGTNGLVSFSGQASDLGNISFPDPNGFSPPNMIAAFWDDLYQPDATTYVEGTAPSRVFIIQWKNIARCCTSFPEVLNMQLWLYEGLAGRFELHYGPQTFTNTGLDASVGFQDDARARGTNLMVCTPNCTPADFSAYTDRRIIATQDAGLDVVAQGLDLGVTGIGRVYQGVHFPVTVNMASFHGEPIGPFRYQIHVMGPGELEPANPIYTSTTVTLTPYQAFRETIDVALPLNQTPGRYRLAVVVDAFNEIDEPDETNNQRIATQEVILGEPNPDFTASFIGQRGASAGPGDTLDIPINVENVGNLDGTTSWTLVVSSNPSPSTNDLVLATGSEAVPLLSNVAVTVPVTVPANLPPGVYTLGVIVDAENAVAELSEVNNAVNGAELVVDGGALRLVGTPPVGYVGLSYEGRLQVAGGIGSYELSEESGTLPPGLSLQLDGRLQGQPEAPGSYTFSVRVQSGDVSQVLGPVTLEIQTLAGPLAIITRELVPGIAGQPYPPTLAGEDPQRLIAIGANAASATFTLVGGGPAGLILDADGLLHGVPASSGRFELEVQASDGAMTTTRRIPLWVVDSGRLTLVPTDLPDAVVGQSYDYNFVVLGRNETATVAFAGAGDVPTGLTLTSDGRLTGRSSQVGTFRFQVTITEGSGASRRTDATEFVLEVLSTPQFSITPSNVPAAILGQSYEVTFEARLGTAPYTWAVETPLLPRGLVGQTIVGVEERFRISGVAEAIPEGMGVETGGVATFRLLVVDALGRRAELPVALRVVPPEAEPTVADDGGCSCRTEGPSGEPSTPWMWALLIFSPIWRRRR